MAEKIIDIIQSVAEDESAELGQEIKLNRERAILFGPGSLLDSLGLVSFIVSLEDAIANQYDVVISLSDDRAVSQKNSPFRSVKTLAVYISNLLEENGINF